jgi:hypothetical protein
MGNYNCIHGGMHPNTVIKKVEPACKPGSVEDSHSSRAYVAVRLKRPTREQRGPRLMLPYLVLLRVGFTLPPVLPQARCALTAPFHPYRRRERRLAVYFLWHWPWAYAPQALPGTLPYGARTFLHAQKDTAAVQPAQVQFNTADRESPKNRPFKPLLTVKVIALVHPPLQHFRHTQPQCFIPGRQVQTECP